MPKTWYPYRATNEPTLIKCPNQDCPEWVLEDEYGVEACPNCQDRAQQRDEFVCGGCGRSTYRFGICEQCEIGAPRHSTCPPEWTEEWFRRQGAA